VDDAIAADFKPHDSGIRRESDAIRVPMELFNGEL
jgi:hypothetical protein